MYKIDRGGGSLGGGSKNGSLEIYPKIVLDPGSYRMMLIFIMDAQI